MIRSTYGASNEGANDIANKTKMWTAVFSDYSYTDIQNALIAYIRTDTKGFAPKPGQLIDLIDTKKRPLTSEEGWACVMKALRNSSYHAEEEYDKLPDDVKLVIRDPGQLREMALMDENDLQTVQKSLFRRSFEAAQQRERDNQKLPESLRAPEIETYKPPMIEEKSDDREPADADMDWVDKQIRQLEENFR